ncbi:titin-like isoform X3 [Artemia franciscana]|uniref:titin-like isoform X3 n=1 Tax=Artemia franciscana TaxID=6661 RepID=UPI0032DA5BC8
MVNGNGSKMAAGDLQNGAAIPTTTLSTIAVKSGNNRIVIGLLESGNYATFRIVEMKPELTSLGDTVEHASQMSEDHNIATAKLQSKHSPVEEMLRQADTMLAGQKPKPEVYNAMAASLEQAWRALNDQLEIRRTILERNVAFHSRATVLRENISQLEKEAKFELPSIRDVETVRVFLGRLQNIRRSCLEASIQALKEGHLLLDTLKELRKLGSIDSRPDFMAGQVNTAISKVESWMEGLHDYRLNVEILWKKKRSLLEQISAICVVKKELESLEKSLTEKRKVLLEKNSLGESQTSAEFLSLEHQKLEPVLKELRDSLVKVTKTAEKLPQSSSAETTDVKNLAYHLLDKCAETQESFENRSDLLALAVRFFQTAQTTVTKLDQLDVQLSTGTFPRGSAGLARLHSQVMRAAEEATAPALHYGYDLLEKTRQTAMGSQGIQNKIEEIEKRSMDINVLCTAHKEEAIRNLEKIQNAYDQIDEIYNWLINVADELIRTHCDLGVNPSTAGEFLELHKQMLNDVRAKGQEMETILLQLPEIYEFSDDPHLSNLKIRFENLKDTWQRIKTALEARTDFSFIYHRFHTLALTLKNDIDDIESNPDLEANDPNLQKAKQLFMQLDDTGKQFMADCLKCDDPFLDSPKASLCAEALLEHLEKRLNDVDKAIQDRNSRKANEQKLQDRWSKISLDVKNIGAKITEILNHVFPVITSEFTTSMIVTKLEEKSMKFSREVGALAEEIKIRANALESFAETDDNIKDLYEKLSNYNSELSRFSFEISTLLQMTTKYYRSLVQVDQTIESLEHQYYTTVLPASVSEVELIIRDHVANYNLIANLISKIKQECDTLIDQYRNVSYETRHDVEILMHSLDQRSRHWEAVWQDRNWRLTQHRQHCQFNSDLMSVQNQIDDMLRQIEGIKNAGRYASSLTMCKANSDSFSQFEKSMDAIEPKIHNFVSTAEKIVNSESEKSRKEPVESGLNAVTTKWSTLRTSVGETKNIIELKATYFTLVEEVEEWFTHGSKLLVNLARRSTLCKSKTDADSLIQEVDKFINDGRRHQEERIKKISEISIQLKAPASASHSEKVFHESREIFESFTSITKELVVLSKNLETAEEERKQAKATESLFRDSLAAAHAEAEAARAAARAAEQARIVAEGIAQSMKNKPRVTVETTQTETESRCDFGSQVSNMTSRRIRLSDVSIQSDEPPVFVETLHDENVIEGQKITLLCKVSGRPRPEVTWYKDGISIENNPDYQTSCIDNVCCLYIEETFAEDTALFTCRAVSFAGFAETSAKLTVKEVQEKEEPIAPDFSVPLTDIHTREGDSITFHCVATGNPAPSVSWFKNGKCIDEKPEYTISNDNNQHTLKIEEIFLEDHGQFICQAINYAGEAETKAMLKVESILPSEPAKVISPLSNVMARAGRKLRLEAKISGKPQPDILWMHNGRPVKETRELKTSFDGEICVLTITEAYPKDAGTYTISAKNIGGEALSSSIVTVKGRLPAENSDTEIGLSDIEPLRPSIKVPLKDIESFNGRKIKMECVISGQPDPEINWFKNDLIIPDSTDYQQIFQGNKVCLIIRQLQLEDTGKYKVIAINSAGEASSECKLTVQEELKPPKFEKKINNISAKINSNVRFDAVVTGTPEPDVTWLRNDMPLYRTEDVLIFNYPNGYHVLELPCIKEEHQGEYTLKATNKAGEAKSIAELALIPPTPPVLKPEDEISLPPQFEKIFSDTRVHKGTPIAFQCITSGIPEPNVKWLFKDRPAEEYPEVSVSKDKDKHTFAILTAELTHSGKIVCVAENESGVATCSATLTVHEPPVMYHSATSIKHVLRQKNEVTNEHKEEKKDQDMNEQKEEVEPAKVSVKERATLFSSSSSTKIAETTQVKFIKVQQKQIPPKFALPLTNCLVDEGARVTMEAVVEGHPLPHISWKFNDNDLLNSDHIKMSVDVNRARLSFLEVLPKDVGMYSCIASNKSGRAVSTAELAIRKPLFPPVIGRRLQAKTVKEGERIHLEIEVTGTPRPQVTWFKDEELINDARAVKKSEGACFSLTIPKGSVFDSGHYKARAENEAGISVSSADILVHRSGQEIITTENLESKFETKMEKREQSVSDFLQRASFDINQQLLGKLTTQDANSRISVTKEEKNTTIKNDIESKNIELGERNSMKSKRIKHEPVSLKAKKLDEFSKSLSPTTVPGGVRLLPTPTEEKTKPKYTEEKVEVETVVSKTEAINFKVDSLEKLEPFPFQPEPPRPRPPVGPPLRKPSKFVKGESKESDYESDLDSRLSVKWVPPGSDTECELAYQKVKLNVKDKKKGLQGDRQKSPTPPTEFDVPPLIEGPPRPKINILETVSAIRQASSREGSIAPNQSRPETPLSTRSMENIGDERKLMQSPRPKIEALEMEKKWVPKKQTTDVVIVKQPIVHTTEMIQSMSPLPSHEALLMEKQWGKKMGGTNIVWPPVNEDDKPFERSANITRNVKHHEHILTSSSRKEFSTSKTVTEHKQFAATNEIARRQEVSSTDSSFDLNSAFKEGYLVGLKASDNKVSVIRADVSESATAKLRHDLPQTVAEPAPAESTGIHIREKEEPQMEMNLDHFSGLSKMKALWEAKVQQEGQIQEIRTSVHQQLVSNEPIKKDGVLSTTLPEISPQKTPSIDSEDFGFQHEVPSFHAKVTHTQPLILEPFPFLPDPIKPKKETKKVPPPVKPKKFIKGEFRESDYESDYDGKIRPKWAPSDSDTEDLMYRPIRPHLENRKKVHVQKEKEAIPPTEFEVPLEPTGVYRPSINIKERIHPEGQEADIQEVPLNISHIRSQESNILPESRDPASQYGFNVPPSQKFKKAAPPPAPADTQEALLNTSHSPSQESNILLESRDPAPQDRSPTPSSQKFKKAAPPPAPQIFLENLPTLGVETAQKMKMRETTANSLRFVSVEQTTRVIKLDKGSDKTKRNSARNSLELSQKIMDPDSDGEGERKRKQRQEEIILEPFPFTPDPPRPRAPKGNLPPVPKKFLKGESRESDYESDIEHLRFRPKWTPAGSDTEDPTYRKVTIPPVSADLQKKLERVEQRSPTPPTVFDKPPVFDGPPRPVITDEDVKNLKDLLLKEGYSQASSNAFIESVTSGKIPIKVSYINAPGNRPIFKAPPPPPQEELTPGDPPEFGYASGQPLDARKGHRETQKQVQFSDIPNVKILGASSDTTEDSNEPQAYREESRVSEFGSKHIDPDSGLIYFKYDFGYEFGIVMPGESQKVQKIQSSEREGDIPVPVIHEKSPRRETPSPRRSPKQSPPSKRASRQKSPSESEASDIEKPKIPSFKPRKITHAKPAKWEPMSESEISEIESTIDRRAPSKYYRERRQLFNRSEHDAGREESFSPLSVSPSVSPYPIGPESLRSTLCDPEHPPIILTPLQDFDSLIGRSVSFSCTATGYLLTFEWFKDGNAIIPSKDYIISSIQGLSQLHIPEVFPEDTGSYTCTVSNPYGSVSTTAILCVHGDKL